MMLFLHRLRAGGVLAAFCALVAAPALAATYYVDQDQGNDAYSGLATAADAATAQGPWQTLARVSLAPLVAGDQVLLRCGQAWREPLLMLRSGAANLPVTIGSYPFGCADKPAIDGGLRVPAQNWVQHSGNIYRATLPLSVLPNGRLDQSVQGWRIQSAGALARMAFNPACPADGGGCAAVTTAAGGGLAISPQFTLRRGQKYTVRMQVLAPAGNRYGTMVRRFSSGYAAQSGYAQGTGTGAWQDLTLSFTAPASIIDARVDLDVPGGSTTTYLRNVRVDMELGAHPVLDMNITGGVMNVAHHPNAGYKPAQPSSVYLAAGTSPSIRGADGRVTSAYVTTGADLVLPAGATITPGLGLWLRSQSWSVRQHTITGVRGNLLDISPNSAYPLSYPGWGYFLTGALWMLDSPGEWFYDADTSTVYAWMPDGAAPGDRVTLSTVPTALVASSPTTGIFPAYQRYQNLALRNVELGAYVSRASNVEFNAVDVRNTLGFGIVGDGTAFMRVTDSVFKDTGSDAIHATSAPDAVITNNTLTHIGVRVDANGQPISLPRENYSAVLTGARSVISGNRLRNAGYIGLQAAGDDSVIADNVVQNFSLVLNDAGGIYGAGYSRVTIRNNIVLDGIGNRDGIPSVLSTLVASLYVDGNGGTFNITGNTFGRADYCVQFHNAYDSILENNTCYGATRTAVRLQETGVSRRATGDVYNNVFRGNRLFQMASAATWFLNSNRTTVDDFGSFDGNFYSTMVSPTAAQESSPGVNRSFTLGDWQQQGLNTGRVIEPTGVVAAPLRRYAQAALDVPVLSTAQSSVSWGMVGSGTPTIVRGTPCGPKGAICVSLNAGTASATLTGPRFNLVKDAVYRVSFDAMVSDAAQVLQVLVLRAGPTYEGLMGNEPATLGGSTTWRRYSFTFRATAAAAPARIDFNGLAAGRTLSVANMEVVPLVANGANGQSALLVNTGIADAPQACPVADAKVCAGFFRFPEGTPVTWPVLLAPRASAVVFYQDSSLPDSDGDGIGDAQDQCPASPAGQAVDSRGCGIAQ